MTRDEAQKMMRARFEEYPVFGAIALSATFKEGLVQILTFAHIGEEFLPLIENEVMVVLSLYAPLSKLGANIAETTGLPIETCEDVASLIESLILDPVIDDLRAYDFLWQQELATTATVPEAIPDAKERLDLRPQGAIPVVPLPPKASQVPPQGARPLTREELMNALSPKRTMATDIEAVRQKQVPEKPKESFPGYEAFRKLDAEKKEE